MWSCLTEQSKVKHYISVDYGASAVAVTLVANLTPWGRVLLEELTVPQAVKLPTFYWTQIFSNEFTKASHLSLS